MDTPDLVLFLLVLNPYHVLPPYSAPSNQNPFGEDEWDDDYGDSGGPVDDGSAGIPVRALYDYDGQESDELTFKVGQYHGFLVWTKKLEALCKRC